MTEGNHIKYWSIMDSPRATRPLVNKDKTAKFRKPKSIKDNLIRAMIPTGKQESEPNHSRPTTYQYCTRTATLVIFPDLA